MQSCPLDRVCRIHPGSGVLPISGWSILKVKVAVPALGLSLATNSSGGPLSQRLVPRPHLSPSLAERKERKMSVGGELEERLVFTITAVGAAVVGLIHPRLFRRVRAPAPPSKVHIAATHSCFLGPVRHLTWQLGRGWALLLLPSHPAWFSE